MPEQLTLNPQSTVLLVMDYQTGILEQLNDAEQLVRRVAAAVDNTRAHGAQVGWVRVALTTDELDAVPQTSIFAPMAAKDQRGRLHPDAPATRIDRRLKPLPEDVTVRKTRVGAFTTTDLEHQLRARSIDTLVLVGVTTSGVVLSTVREAMDRDYRIVVLKNACADREREVHSFLVERVFPGLTHVIGSDDLGGLWA